MDLPWRRETVIRRYSKVHFLQQICGMSENKQVWIEPQACCVKFYSMGIKVCGFVRHLLQMVKTFLIFFCQSLEACKNKDGLFTAAVCLLLSP